jgi:AcrR family transcriptional regulator
MAATAPADALREELSERQVDLIRATYRLIAERGIRRLSLQEIADAAGVSKALLLYHFGRKQALVLATMRWVLLRAEERIRTAIEAVETPEQVVEAMVDAIFTDPEANFRFYRTQLDLLDSAFGQEEFGQLSWSYRTIVNALYEEVVSGGLAAGAFAAEDVAEASTVIRAIVDGLFLQWLQEERPAEAHPRYREVCKRAILAYLGAGG